MTNNTIPNVPRELLEELRDAANESMNATTRQHQIDYFAGLIAKADALLSAPSPANHVEDVRAMVADPSPAGVDGLEVATFLHTMHMELGQTEQFCSKWKGDPFGVSGVDYSSTYSVTSEPLCRLSDAQAIIDGLRGEVEVMTQHANNYSLMFEECAEERDHLAQCLKFARTTMAVVANNANLRGVEYRSLVTEVKRIDAALAAVCAAAPNITPTSEHSGS